MSKIKIKVCGLTKSDDAEFCVRFGINFLGFNFFNQSKRYITPQNAANIIQYLKNKFKLSDFKTVGVFVHSTIEDIVRMNNMLNLDFVQLHSDETPEFCFELQRKNLHIIKAFRIDDIIVTDEINKFIDCSDFFLFDKKEETDFGGTGKIINWQLFGSKKITKNFFIAGGLGPDNCLEAVKLTNAFGIDINSKVEISAGIKDKNKIKKVLQILA